MVDFFAVQCKDKMQKYIAHKLELPLDKRVEVTIGTIDTDTHKIEFSFEIIEVTYEVDCG